MAMLPLENVRILEIAEGVAGPWACSLLGDLGAQVIKIEAIQRMDQTRGQKKPKAGTHFYPNGEPGDQPWNINLTFIRTNRNKMSLTLDLSREKGLNLFKELVRVSDALLTNMVTGVPEKLGIDYTSLKKIRPDIIMLTSCGYGHSGPYARNVAMAGSMDPISGHTWLRGYEGEDPLSTSYSSHTDSVNAATNAFALVTALHHRRATGQGQHIDVSGIEALMPHLGESILDYTMNGRARNSIGNRHPQLAPHNVYRAAGDDQWVAIAVRNDHEWQAFCSAIDEPEWTRGSSFQTALGRWHNREELDRLIEGWTSTLPSRNIMSRLQHIGVPASLILDNKAVWSDPHVRASGFFELVRHQGLGEMEMSGLPWKMPATQGAIRLPAPLLGEHNDLIYTGLLGLPDSDYRSLIKEGFAGTEPLDRAV